MDIFFIVTRMCFVLTNETSSDVSQITSFENVHHSKMQCGKAINGMTEEKNNEIHQGFGCTQSYIDLGVGSKNTIDYISSGTIEACKIQYLWRVGIQDFMHILIIDQ